MKARGISFGILSLALLAGCGETPTSLESSAADALAAESGQESAVRGGGPAQLTPLLQQLLQQALKKVATEQGAEAARAVAAELKSQHQEIVRAATAEGTPEARQRAAAAIQLATAQVVVRIQGVSVVERVLGVAAERIAALEARIAAAGNRRTTADATALVARLKEQVSLARAALAAGNNAQALIHATHAAQGALRVAGVGASGGPRR